MLYNRDERQMRVVVWGAKAFGLDHMSDPGVRAARFLEEACELAQAAGLDRDHALRVLWYVYGRPAGDVRQELGGAGVTLLALAAATGHSADACEVAEIVRCESKPLEHWSARNRTKVEEVDRPPAAQYHPSPSKE